MITLTKATKRNTPAHWVCVNGVDILFSYETPVAFTYDGRRLRRHNDWGPTTGRHMNDARVRDWPEASSAVSFNEQLQLAVLQSFKDIALRQLAAA